MRAGLAGHAVPDPEEAVETAVSEAAVLVFQEEETAEEPDGDEDAEEETSAPEQEPAAPVLLGLDLYALAEESLADGLARLVRTATADTWEGGELERAVGAHRLVLHNRRRGPAPSRRPRRAARERGLGATLVAVHAGDGRRAAGLDAVTVADLLSRAAGPAATRRAPSPWTSSWCSTRRSWTWRPARCCGSRCRTAAGWC
ncbi:ATP-binding domain-containing protein [Streptomyces tanashiensis]